MKRLTEEALAESRAIARPLPERVTSHPGWAKFWRDIFALCDAQHAAELAAQAAERHDDEADAA